MTTSSVKQDTAAPDEAFGRAVFMVMFDKKVTQTRLAAALGIHQTALSKKLRGQRPWTLSEIVQTSSLLRVDLTDLLAGIQAQYPNVNFGWSTQTAPRLHSVTETVEDRCAA